MMPIPIIATEMPNVRRLPQRPAQNPHNTRVIAMAAVRPKCMIPPLSVPPSSREKPRSLAIVGKAAAITNDAQA